MLPGGHIRLMLNTASPLILLNDLLDQWYDQEQALKSIIEEDINAFNEMYAQQAIPALVIPNKE